MHRLQRARDTISKRSFQWPMERPFALLVSCEILLTAPNFLQLHVALGLQRSDAQTLARHWAAKHCRVFLGG